MSKRAKLMQQQGEPFFSKFLAINLQHYVFAKSKSLKDIVNFCTVQCSALPSTYRDGYVSFLVLGRKKKRKIQIQCISTLNFIVVSFI